MSQQTLIWNAYFNSNYTKWNNNSDNTDSLKEQADQTPGPRTESHIKSARLRLPLHSTSGTFPLSRKSWESYQLNFLLKAGSVSARHKGWEQTHRMGPQRHPFWYSSSPFPDPRISLPPPVHTVMDHTQLLHPNTQFKETHGFLALKWLCFLFSFLCYPVGFTSYCTAPC